MKKHFNFWCRWLNRPLISASLMLLVSISSIAQTNSLFTSLNISAGNLDSIQTLRYNKVLEYGRYLNYQFIRVEPLIASQNEGQIKLTFNQNDCGSSLFKIIHSKYENENEYYWYGHLIIDPVDSTTLCTTGSAMLLSKNGEHFGQVKIEGVSFEIIDLTGGIQVLAEIEELNDSLPHCKIADADVLEKTTTTGDGNICKVRVLALYTPAADAQEPNINNRIQLAVSQTKQAMLNSHVYSSDFDWDLVGTFPLNYTEDIYNSSIPGSGTGTDLENIATGTISTTVNNLRNNLFFADLVILFTASSPDPTRGVAWLWQNNDPYLGRAVVQTGSATNDGYTFAHEFGHLLGALHEQGDPNDQFPNDQGHAHDFEYKTGWWIFKKKHDAKTITYGATAGDKSVILNYSNPSVQFNGISTGVTGTRNAVANFKLADCDIASYVAGGEDNFTVNINGPWQVCPDAAATLYPQITGPSGTYQYEWFTSTDGINYGSVQSTSSYSFVAYGGQHVKLKVTAPNSQVKYAYQTITTVMSINGLPCALRLAPKMEFGNKLITVYPNPANQSIGLNIELANDENIKLELYDIFGRQVKVLYDGYAYKGNQSVNFEISDVSDGIYTIQFSTNSGFNSVKKLIIQN